LLVLGLAVHLLLPQIASLEHSVQVIRQMALWAVGLAILAQVTSYLGSGYLLSALVSLSGSKLSIWRGTLIMDEAEAPTRVEIRKPAEVKNDPKSKEIVNTIELMKALMRGEQPSGSVSSKLHHQEIFNNDKFRIVADEVYELQGGAKAFVLTFENLGSKPVVVPVEHIELPGLLAISVDSQMLEARPRDTAKKPSGFSTKAYMITDEANP